MHSFRAERLDARPGPAGALFRAQVAELLRVRNPARRPTDTEVDAWIAAAGEPVGVFWQYPWRGAAVHLLAEDEFREVRESRNRYKITRDEAQRLRGARVAVVGLSVGQAILVSLVMERVAGVVRFSDPDTLDLSNLNRLRASVLDLGLPKWVIAARAVAELDPYLPIEPWPDPVTPGNVEAFLDGVDVLVEECDDLPVKLLVRAAARRRGIPVVMHTSDRGLLDVERFDLDPTRPVFHGLVGDLDTEALANLSPAEKVPVVARILGEPSARSALTLPEVGLSVASWPQLASEVNAGAAAVTEVVRRILLGERIPSGRWVNDLEAKLATEPLFATPATTPPPPYPLLPPGLPPPDDPIAFVVTAASLAPSAHNVQPWRFVADGDTVHGYRVPERWASLLDGDGLFLDAMLGSALENLVVAASALGRGVEVTPGDGARVWSASLTGRSTSDPLVAALAERHTNRRLPDPTPIAPEFLERLVEEAAVRGCRLLLTRPDEALGRACAGATRAVALDPRLHEEMMGQLRWDRAEVLATRDGLDVDTLELDGAQRIGLRLFTNPAVARAAGMLGIGRRIGAEIGEGMVRAPCAALLVMPSESRAGAVAAGRALERVWLRATLAGLAVYPLAALCQLWPFAQKGGLAPEVTEELARHRDVWERHFPLREGERELILLRIAYGPPATARSLRRPLSDVFERRS